MTQQFIHVITDASTGEVAEVPFTQQEIDAYITSITPTLEQQFEAVRMALQNAIDVKARSLGFSGGNALMLYVGFTNTFQSLAQTFATWEASVWVEAEAYRQEVIAETKPMLNGEQAVLLMPEYPA